MLNDGPMLKQHRTSITYTAAGMLGGYLIFHPYAMAVYFASHMHEKGEIHLHWRELVSRALQAFDPMMLAMSIPFIVFGGVIGLLVGKVLERARRLNAEKLEREKQKVALDTLKNLMVTLSHYLLNANMIIGGQVRRCRKATSDKNIVSALVVIEEQGRKIDAVVGALRESTEVKVAGYTSDDKIQMIDISGEIEERLNPNPKSPHE